MNAANINEKRNAYLLFLERILCERTPMPDRKNATIGIWNTSPKQKQPHKIKEIIEFIDKIIFSSWAKETRKSKLKGIRTE